MLVNTFRKHATGWIAGLILLSLATACAPGGGSQEARLGDLEARLEALEARLDGLQTQLESQSNTAQAEAAHADVFTVSMAQYVLDNAGFHGMEETINASGEIDPAYLGQVNQVRKILSNAPWPEQLAGQGQEFLDLLDEFAVALEADDAGAAAGLSEAVHDAQHELSHDIDVWLGEASEHED